MCVGGKIGIDLYKFIPTAYAAQSILILAGSS